MGNQSLEELLREADEKAKLIERQHVKRPQLHFNEDGSSEPTGNDVCTQCKVPWPCGVVRVFELPRKLAAAVRELEVSCAYWQEGCEERARLLVQADSENQRLTAELAGVRKENDVLRGLVQTNPEWKCPYGYLRPDGSPLPTMGHCPLGFPGCACADDRLAAEEEAVLRLAAERDSLRADLDKIQKELDHKVGVIRRLQVGHDSLREQLGVAKAARRQAMEQAYGYGVQLGRNGSMGKAYGPQMNRELDAIDAALAQPDGGRDEA